MLNQIIINDDCLVAMKTMPDNSVDLVCTDPPYGYSFMGKDWDTFNEVVEPQGSFQSEKGFKKLPRNKPNGMYAFMLPIWTEALRVLKPGAFALVMCAPRQDVLCEQIRALTDAGFNMSFSSIYWTYSSGFPKAHNVGKILDKRERKFDVEKYAVKSIDKPIVPCVDGSGYNVVDYTKGVSVEDKESGTGGISRGASGVKQMPAWIPVYETDSPFQGAYGGFQPKPAVEIIIVAMKPMIEKTFASQALSNGHGITWMDDCRMPYASDNEVDTNRIKRANGGEYVGGFGTDKKPYTAPLFNNKGRFPANLLVSDDVLNNGVESKGGTYNQYNNGGGFDNLGDGTYNHGATIKDKGSYSRYFDLDKWSEVNNIKPENNTFPFLICPKAGKKEKNNGCEALDDKDSMKWAGGNEMQGVAGTYPDGTPRPKQVTKNNHPTVKPIKLMSYLITLGSREGDVVLDPFAGSGTTLVAAKNLKRQYIGCEMSAEYCEIIKARLSSVIEEEEKQTNEFFG